MSVNASAAACIGVERRGRSALALRFAGNASRWLWLMATAAAFLAAAGTASWAFSGFPQPLAGYLWRLGAFCLVAFSVAEYVLALACWRRFGRDEPMRWAWLLITLAAGSRAAGLVVVSLRSGFEIGRDALAQGSVAQTAAAAGLSSAFANPLALALLAGGLLAALRACGQAGVLRRPSAFEMASLMVLMLFMAGRFVAILRSPSASAGLPGLVQGINASVYPLMGLLLVLAVMLREPVQQMGDGLIGRCWGGYIAAIFFTAVASMGNWATSAGYMPWQYGFVNSAGWLLAALAFALAPAHQLEAAVRARHPWLRSS